NPSAAIRAAEGAPVAILNRNTPEAYLVPADAWEAILEALDDLRLAEIVRERQGQKRIRVDIDDLSAGILRGREKGMGSARQHDPFPVSQKTRAAPGQSAYRLGQTARSRALLQDQAALCGLSPHLSGRR